MPHYNRDKQCVFLPSAAFSGRPGGVDCSGAPGPLPRAGVFWKGRVSCVLAKPLGGGICSGWCPFLSWSPWLGRSFWPVTGWTRRHLYPMCPPGPGWRRAYWWRCSPSRAFRWCFPPGSWRWSAPSSFPCLPPWGYAPQGWRWRYLCPTGSPAFPGRAPWNGWWKSTPRSMPSAPSAWAATFSSPSSPASWDCSPAISSPCTWER